MNPTWLGNQHKVVRDYIRVLRRDRKAALRECGRLGDLLHFKRLEVTVLHRRIQQLEHRLAEVTDEFRQLHSDAIEAESR